MRPKQTHSGPWSSAIVFIGLTAGCPGDSSNDTTGTEAEMSAGDDTSPSTTPTSSSDVTVTTGPGSGSSTSGDDDPAETTTELPDSGGSEMTSTSTGDCSANPPSLAPVEDQLGAVDVPLNLQLMAVDGDGDEITYFGEALPIGSTLDVNTGYFTWTPSNGGKYSLGFGATDGCNDATIQVDVKILDGTEDVDGDGFAALVDCNDSDAFIHPLKPGENTISKNTRICDGTYDSSVRIKGSGITVEAEKFGVFLDGGYIILDGLKNSTVRMLNVINAEGTTNGTGWFPAGLYLTHADKNTLQFVSAVCNKNIPTCNFTGLIQSSSGNLLDDCVLAEGDYSLMLTSGSDNNTIQSTKFISPETTWIENQGTGNKFIANEYL